jgi:hypothetical protein
MVTYVVNLFCDFFSKSPPNGKKIKTTNLKFQYFQPKGFTELLKGSKRMFSPTNIVFSRLLSQSGVRFALHATQIVFVITDLPLAQGVVLCSASDHNLAER